MDRGVAPTALPQSTALVSINKLLLLLMPFPPLIPGGLYA
jgi:hypothetical protein